MTKHDGNTVPGATVAVWDPLLRIFHWALVAFFAIAWVTGEGNARLHEWSGYAVAALLLFRLFWGVAGTSHARFSSLDLRPRSALAYLRGLLTGERGRHLGHNPAGAAMMVALLLGLVALTLTGMLLAGTEGSGPFAGTALARLREDPLEELHEVLAYGLLGLVALHVTGVLASSLCHRENLVMGMITGRKRAVTLDSVEETVR